MGDKQYIKGVAAGVAGSILVFSGLYVGAGFAPLSRKGVLSEDKYVQKLNYLEELIDAQYLEETDEDQLAEGLYAGLLAGLGDPYSRYYTAEEYEEENISDEGSYVGIGVALEANTEGGLRIAECYEGGPGEAAGLKPDDIISAVNGTDIIGMETADVVTMIRESPDETVELTVHRTGEEEPLVIQVEISDVELPSVFAELLDDAVGYIRISQFTGVTYEQYVSAFEELREQGMEKLVVDLRGNPGGLMTSVCDILGEILPEGVIVYTEDKDGNREEMLSEGKNPLEIPLAVLVNSGSASASEIFAGAVQDYGIGTIVGTTTFGKGIVQAMTPLSDGSAVKLTVSRYYTPNGNSIHEVGIQPDIEVELDADLLGKEEITHEEDNQLQAALAAI